MKKRGKKVKVINYEAIERLRVYTMKQILECLNDDSCNLSSCEIRKHLLDAVG